MGRNTLRCNGYRSTDLRSAAKAGSVGVIPSAAIRVELEAADHFQMVVEQIQGDLSMPTGGIVFKWSETCLRNEAATGPFSSMCCNCVQSCCTGSDQRYFRHFHVHISQRHRSSCCCHPFCDDLLGRVVARYACLAWPMKMLWESPVSPSMVMSN